MDKIKIMMEIGKMEVRFEENEQILNELSHFRDKLCSEDILQVALAFGRIQERIGETDKSVQEIYRILNNTKNFFDMSIEEIGLTDRTYKVLTRANIKTVRQITQMTKEDFYKIRNMGQKNYDEIIGKMHQLNLDITHADKITN